MAAEPTRCVFWCGAYCLNCLRSTLANVVGVLSWSSPGMAGERVFKLSGYLLGLIF
jgi:hypothetical protein